VGQLWFLAEMLIDKPDSSGAGSSPAGTNSGAELKKYHYLCFFW